MSDQQTRQKRLSIMALQQGLHLSWITDLNRTNARYFLVGGTDRIPRLSDATLDQVERYLTNPNRPGWRRDEDGNLRWHGPPDPYPRSW
jgi:hypothetical protein